MLGQKHAIKQLQFERLYRSCLTNQQIRWIPLFQSSIRHTNPGISFHIAVEDSCWVRLQRRDFWTLLLSFRQNMPMLWKSSTLNTLRFQWLDMILDLLWLLERILTVLTTSYLEDLLTVSELFSTFLAINGAVEITAIVCAASGLHVSTETFAIFHAINCLRALQSFHILSKFRGPQLLLIACKAFANSLPPGCVLDSTDELLGITKPWQ